MKSTSILVDEFTTPYPLTVSEDMMVDELRDLMDKHGIRHLPVVRDDVVVGMISDRDVRLVVGLSHAEKMQVQAGDLMRTDLVFVNADTPLDQVAQLMAERKVGSVIVNDPSGRPAGIFTATDALRALAQIVRRSGQ